MSKILKNMIYISQKYYKLALLIMIFVQTLRVYYNLLPALMDKRSVYEIEPLWWNVAIDYSIFVLFSLVGFMLFYAFKESYCDNAFNLIQKCILWLRKQRQSQASQHITSSQNSLSNKNEQQQYEQTQLNLNMHEQKNKFITRANSEIVNKKQQNPLQQKPRQRQQSSGGELKKVDQNNKESSWSQKVEVSNMKQSSPKSSKIIKQKERELPQKNYRQIYQEQFRNRKNQSQKNLRQSYNPKESNNPQSSIKQQIAQQSRTLLETINKKELQIKQLEDNLAHVQKQNKYLRESLQNAQKTSSSSIDRENNFRLKIEQLQRMEQQNRSQNSQLQKQIKELLATQKQNLAQLERLKKELKQKKGEIITLTQRDKANEDYIHKLEAQNHNKNIELQRNIVQRSRILPREHQRISNQQLSEFKALQQKYDKLQLTIQQQHKLFIKKQQELEKLQRQNANLKQELTKNYEQTQQLIDNLKQRQHELITLLKKKEDQAYTKSKQMQALHSNRGTQQHENRKVFDRKQHEISDLKLQLQGSDLQG